MLRTLHHDTFCIISLIWQLIHIWKQRSIRTSSIDSVLSKISCRCLSDVVWLISNKRRQKQWLEISTHAKTSNLTLFFILRISICQRGVIKMAARNNISLIAGKEMKSLDKQDFFGSCIGIKPIRRKTKTVERQLGLGAPPFVLLALSPISRPCVQFLREGQTLGIVARMNYFYQYIHSRILSHAWNIPPPKILSQSLQNLLTVQVSLSSFLCRWLERCSVPC